MKKPSFFLFGAMLVLISFNACKKDNLSTGALYTPTASDITATATLDELQQGRTLYINNCGACHGLYSPDNFSPAQWKNVLTTMVPRTGLSTSEACLVSKYVSKGN